MQFLIVFALVAATLAEEQAVETKKDKRGIYGGYGYGGYGYSSYAAPISQAVSVVTKEVPVPVPHPVAVPVEKHVPVPVKVKIVSSFPFHAKKKKKMEEILSIEHNLWRNADKKECTRNRERHDSMLHGSNIPLDLSGISSDQY